ncbi:MAG: V-type ATP synthase subunit D [Planctomycetes bacterium]|nr:V-type ATP synthase subunit D [Planctomycetota bacterium]
MSRLPLAPTKGNLLAVKDELGLASEAYELMERKRDVLVNELMRYADRLREVEREFYARFGRGITAFRTARALLGASRMRQALSFPVVENEFSILDRSVMGVHIIELSITKTADEPMPGPAESVPEFEEAGEHLHKALEVLGEYVTRMGSVWRLATEVKKTQRRLNALENIFIPQYRETAHFIQGVLEENEREEFFRQKRVKSKLARGG